MTSQHQQHAGAKRFSIQSDPAEIHRAIVEDGVAIIEGFLTPDTPTRWMTSFAITWPASQLDSTSAVTRFSTMNCCTKSAAWPSKTQVILLELRKCHQKWPGTSEQNWRRDQPRYPVVKEGPDATEGMLNFFTALADFHAETNTIYFGQQRTGGT